MITTPASGRFEARVISFPTGLTGSVGVRILDNEGVTVKPRTSLGIHEDPAGSGSYVVVLNAPPSVGDFTVFWDWDGGGALVPSHTAAEDLIVTPAVTSATTVHAPPVGQAVAATIPHLSLPFRLINGTVAVSEQDTVEEILDCCELVLRCPQGHRIELPAFGAPDQALREGGASPAAVEVALNRWEPRSRAIAAADLSAITDAVSRVSVETRAGAAEQ